MAPNIPRFSTTPTISKLPTATEDASIGRSLVQPITKHHTTPAGRGAPIGDLSDVFAKRAEAERARGELEKAEVEDKRARTLHRVKTTLAQVRTDKTSTTTESKPGLPRRIFTSFKERTTGKRKAGISRTPMEIEERNLLKEFRKYNKSRVVTLPTFKKIFALRGEHFGEQLFRHLDRDNTGFVLDEEIVGVLVALEKGSFEEKVAFLWSFITSDGDLITRKELKELIKASASEGNLKLGDEALESLATAFFTAAKVGDRNALTQEQFKNALIGRQELVGSLKLGSLRHGPPMMDNAMGACCGFDWQIRMLPWYEQVSTAISKQLHIENIQMFFVLFVIILAELAAFVVGFLQNDHGDRFTILGWSYPVAKGAARSIQVILIAFPFTIARNLITALRPTVMAMVLPLDEHLKLHRQLAYHFFFWGLAHSIAHFINGARIDKPARYSSFAPPPMGKVLYPERSPPTPPPPPGPSADYHWYAEETQVTGLLLLGIMVVGYLFVMFKVMHDRAMRNRASRWVQSLTKLVGNFEAFYFSHIAMAFSLLVLLIIHPYPYIHEARGRSTTWLYMLPGVAIYLLELIVRNFKQWLWKTRILDIKMHPGKVTELQLEVPKWAHRGWRGFTYRPGQYAFVNVPSISRWEWHPFSLTSAPGDNFISFHIGAAGNWTTTLHERSMKALEAPLPMPVSLDASILKENPFDADEEDDVEAPKAAVSKQDLLAKRQFFSVRVDGPFGAPAQDYSKHEILLLVGAGIGATPFASVLRQLVHDFNASKCWNCKRSNHKLFGVRKCYFYWTIREQRYPLAFQKTLEEVKAADAGDFLEINIHLTSSTADDFRTTMARVANALRHEQQGKDAFTGIQSSLPTFFGRPVWSNVLTKIALENPGGNPVGVFVCGPAMLTAGVNSACSLFNMGSPEVINPSRTKFLFHKEIF